jgi:hypothetical protein
LDTGNLASNASFSPKYSGVNAPKYIAQKGGFIEITKKNGYLLSGKFEFETINSIPIYKITKGEFNNISYYQNIIR